MKAFLKKLTSRKFLAAVAGVVVGVALIFGVDEGTITTVAGAVTSVASIIAYINGESKIDAAGVAGAIRVVVDGTSDADTTIDGSSVIDAAMSVE